MEFTTKEYLQDLEKVVNIDSNSNDLIGVAKVADFFEDFYKNAGFFVKRQTLNETVGPALIITNRAAERYDVLILCHMDTVFAAGTVAERPFSVDADGIARGPGVADMKAGCLMAAYVLREMKAKGSLDDVGNVCVLYTPEEETGSVYSTELIKEYGKRADRCIVMEPARASGNFVNGRKGVGMFDVIFRGQAAHAGVEPQKGANAVNQFLLTGAQIIALADIYKGTTINIGVINGGSGANIVPDLLKIEVDVRITETSEGERIHKAMHALAGIGVINGVTIEVVGEFARPAWPLTPEGKVFCDKVDEICKKLEIDAGWEFTGGGSDGNFTAALGVPTIDGFGPIGGNAHRDDEYMNANCIAERSELLKEVIKYCIDKK